MPKPKRRKSLPSAHAGMHGDSRVVNPARIYMVSQETRCLDPTELVRLEQAFRSWATASPRRDVRASRKRILLIFLFIRYTAARLSEVLALDLRRDVDPVRSVVRYGDAEGGENWPRREVRVSSELLSEVRMILNDASFSAEAGSTLKVDAGHVRRKFYERSEECGFPQDLSSPNAVRRARAVELMHSNVPLPVVQRILGQSSPNLTASIVAFSEEDIRQVEQRFVEQESRRKTSARNTFFGKISTIDKGDIQSRIELVTLGGDVVTTVITNNSLAHMGLKRGSLITAEVKAPWVILEEAQTEPRCTAENLFHGTVTHVIRGKLTTEFIVRVSDGTELCSVVTEKSRRRLGIKEHDPVWVMFNSFAVILHVD
jgi:molybdate transport system regulatory protein